MIEVGAFEAKTHLSSLLDKVQEGEEVLIPRRGKAVARLVSAHVVSQSDLRATIDQLDALRREMTLRGLGWKSLRDEGRR